MEHPASSRLEKCPGYERHLLDSVRRQPTEFNLLMANRAINGGIISRRIASVELIDLLTSVAEDPRAHAPGPEVFCNIGALATGTHNETGDARESPARGW